MSDDEKSIWAKLKPINDKNKDVIELKNDKFTIGRSSKCDLSFHGNKLLSSEHACIEKDGAKVVLIDKSQNGTVINFKKTINKDKHTLSHKDKIFFVYRLNEPEKNIGYEIEICDRKSNEKDNDKSTKRRTTSSDEDVVKPKKEDVVEAKKTKFDEVKKEDEKKIEKKDETKASSSSGTSNVNSSSAVDDDYADTLTCSICQEIMHDCISLQPCLHTFCAGCYSEWMEKSDLCPVCRVKVDRICKNHIVNNLIEAYLKHNPNKKRSDDDIKKLEAKNKITKDMLYPKNLKKKKKNDDYEDDDYNEDYSEDELEDEQEQEEDEEDEPYVPPIAVQPLQFGFAAANPFNMNYNNPFQNNFNNNNLFGFNNNYNNAIHRYQCRQCPAYQVYNQAPANPKYPKYTCSLVQNHVLCQCCLEPMPDRNAEIANNPQLPKQSCSACFKSFCNLYWGCKKGDCKGCLAVFQDHKFENDIMFDLINENQHESKILSDYLTKSNKTVKDLFGECIRKLKNGVYKSTIINTMFPNEKVVCRTCALRAFREAAFLYRKDIPNDQLPAEVISRADCKWGKNCRTQKHNLDHAKRYNHICEQNG